MQRAKELLGEVRGLEIAWGRGERYQQSFQLLLLSGVRSKCDTFTGKTQDFISPKSH